jgi:hypothetical protein
MFFRSPVSLLLAAVLLVVGSVQFFLGRGYAGAAKSEATAIGAITFITGGRGGSTYDYEFEIDGVKLEQDSGTCQTPLTPQGCRVGAPVLVYYAHTPVLETRLQEFGAASREKYFKGGSIAGCGLLLIGLHFLFKRALASPDESEDTEEGSLNDGPEIIHIVPGE